MALGAGLAAHSLTLVAFGIDSVVELLSAVVLLWRLDVELRRGAQFSERVERTAGRLSGGLLGGLAAYVIAASAWRLWTHSAQEFSVAGLCVALVAIPVMVVLSRRKLAIADAIGSGALRADAMESIACGYLSCLVVGGLAAQYLVGAWWIDAISALVIVPFLLKEGREAWRGDCSCH